jgi:hypothetical protein
MSLPEGTLERTRQVVCAVASCWWFAGAACAADEAALIRNCSSPESCYDAVERCQPEDAGPSCQAAVREKMRRLLPRCSDSLSCAQLVKACSRALDPGECRHLLASGEPSFARLDPITWASAVAALFNQCKVDEDCVAVDAYADDSSVCFRVNVGRSHLQEFRRRADRVLPSNPRSFRHELPYCLTMGPHCVSGTCSIR